MTEDEECWWAVPDDDHLVRATHLLTVVRQCGHARPSGNVMPTCRAHAREKLLARVTGDPYCEQCGTWVPDIVVDSQLIGATQT